MDVSKDSDGRAKFACKECEKRLYCHGRMVSRVRGDVLDPIVASNGVL